MQKLMEKELKLSKPVILKIQKAKLTTELLGIYKANAVQSILRDFPHY
jgi:hypothetical protein